MRRVGPASCTGLSRRLPPARGRRTPAPRLGNRSRLCPLRQRPLARARRHCRPRRHLPRPLRQGVSLSGLGRRRRSARASFPLSCQANGSDSCCGGPVRDPAQETHAVLSPTSSRPLVSERRRGSAMHHPSCIIDQLPVSHDTARAPRIQSLAGGSAGIFPAPVTVQMRKLRESRSHNGLGGRAGRRVQASRDPVPGSVPSHTPLIQRGDSDTHPHRGRGSGVPRRGPAWGRRIKAAQRPPRLSLFLLCPLSAQPALRAGEAGKGAPSRKQGPARGAPGSTRRRVT